jgi:hypothetical protein
MRAKDRRRLETRATKGRGARGVAGTLGQAQEGAGNQCLHHAVAGPFANVGERRGHAVVFPTKRKGRGASKGLEAGWSAVHQRIQRGRGGQVRGLVVGLRSAFDDRKVLSRGIFGAARLLGKCRGGKARCEAGARGLGHLGLLGPAAAHNAGQQEGNGRK